MDDYEYGDFSAFSMCMICQRAGEDYVIDENGFHHSLCENCPIEADMRGGRE